MALDFPPGTPGATYTGPNGVIWSWDGAKWISGTSANVYAPILSPAFQGNPTAPTPAPGDADTSIATTAFVAAAVPVASSTTPLMDGAAAIGSGTTWAKADHVHPVDTSRLAVAGGATTGALTVTTSLSVNAPTGWSAFNMTRTAGNANQMAGTTSGSTRWTVMLGDQSAETGSNVGSNFTISRYNDAGAYLNNPLNIGRVDGVVTMPNGLKSVGYGVQPGVGGPFGPSMFNINWTGVATLWIDASSVGQFSFVSDYRIKRDIEPLQSTWDRVKALRPISYRHQDYTPANSTRAVEAGPFIPGDDTERWGFVAHELQDTLIEDAATGVKDSPDHIQSPNPWTLLATLTRALQEAMIRIEALEGAAARRK